MKRFYPPEPSIYPPNGSEKTPGRKFGGFYVAASVAVCSGAFLGSGAQAVVGCARGAVYSGADFYTKMKSRHLLTGDGFL